MAVPIIKLTRGVPAPETFPTAQLIECASAVLSGSETGAVLQYGPVGGYSPLRQHIAQEAGVEEKRVIIGQGSLHLQDMIAKLLVKPGDLVYVEEPSYDRTITLLRRVQARIAGIALEPDGIDISALEKRLKTGERPLLFYLIPDFQNPSGTVLSFEKRQRLAALAEEYGFWIIEDSPYRRLRYWGNEIRSLFELAPERVMKMSSYSKLIAPGLRVGYVIAPPQIVAPLTQYAEDTYITPSYLNQAIVMEFIRRGWLETNLEKIKLLYGVRLESMLAALANSMGDLANWIKPEGGFFIGLTLKTRVKASDLLARASQANLNLTDGRGFFVSGAGDEFVRLPFCALTPQEITAGIERLAGVVRQIR
jgi:2-aminoadipate transaminase